MIPENTIPRRRPPSFWLSVAGFLGGLLLLLTVVSAVAVLV
jgi:hypothetical protein